MAVPNDYPELKKFVLPNVQLTGTKIGSGAYGSVEEVIVPGAIYAAKKLHEIFQDPFKISATELDRAKTQFVRECQLMSTLCHRNIVQFKGVCFMSGTQLPVLVMERLVTNLHNLLDPQPPPPPDASEPFFPLSLKCAILTDVATGLAYLHQHSPPIIHRDLSATNIVLDKEMVAQITDFGMARIVPSRIAAVTMTKGPGNMVYMPPETMEDSPEGKISDEINNEKSKAKYDASIDIFSFGVVAIFTLCRIFPCDLLAPTYREGRQLIARTELERRERYMMMICRQLREKHPLLKMIEGCLDFPENRPSIGDVLCLLEKARAEVKDEHTDTNKLELLQALHIEPRTQAEDKHSCSPEAKKLSTIIDRLPISEEEKKTAKKWTKSNSKGLIKILLTGRTGAGKSTLVNAIVGKEVAKRGNELRAEMMNVTCYKMATEEGMDVEVWDSPGLQDGSGNEEEYLTQLKEKCSNVDIIIYCINISATRSEFKEGQNDISAIKKLTATFGPQWWKHSIFAMTFANLLETMLKTELDVRQGVVLVLELEQQSQLEEMFNDRILEWKVAIHGALLATGVPNKIVKNLRVLPAGAIIEPHLPGRQYWLSQLWFVLLFSAKQDCQLKLLTLNKDRIEQEGDTNPEDFRKKGHQQPIVYKKEWWHSLVPAFVYGGTAGGLFGAAALTMAAEGAVGAAVGSSAGAAAGSTVGTIAGPVGMIAGAIFGTFLYGYLTEK